MSRESRVIPLKWMSRAAAGERRNLSLRFSASLLLCVTPGLRAAVHQSGSATRTGTLVSMVVPFPNCPTSPKPQQYAAPLVVMPQA